MTDKNKSNIPTSKPKNPKHSGSTPFGESNRGLGGSPKTTSEKTSPAKPPKKG